MMPLQSQVIWSLSPVNKIACSSTADTSANHAITFQLLFSCANKHDKMYAILKSGLIKSESAWFIVPYWWSSRKDKDHERQILGRRERFTRDVLLRKICCEMWPWVLTELVTDLFVATQPEIQYQPTLGTTTTEWGHQVDKESSTAKWA